MDQQFTTCAGPSIEEVQQRFNPTTIHATPRPMWQAYVSDERDKPDGSSSVSMRRAQ